MQNRISRQLAQIYPPGSDAPTQLRTTLAMFGSGGLFGTVRAQIHLREVLGHNDLRVMQNPSLMLMRGGTLFDADGHLHDEPSREHLTNFLRAFRDWIIQFR